MTDAQTLQSLLGEWVTVRNPDLPVSWYGRLIGLHDDPGLLLDVPGRGGTCLPQRFTVTAAAPPTSRPVPQEEAHPFAELRDAGLLWLINRIAFHPRGLALVLHFDDSGTAYGWSLAPNEGGPWQFDASTDTDGYARAEATIAAALSGRPDQVDDITAVDGGIVHRDTDAQASAPPQVDEPAGPQRLNCPERCEIPPAITLTEVPEPRHAWADVHRCPNDGCGRAFLADTRPDASPDTPETTGGHTPGPDAAEQQPVRPTPATSTDTVRTCPDTDTADTSDPGVRVEYRATVRRDQVHLAIAEAFDVISRETGR